MSTHSSDGSTNDPGNSNLTTELRILVVDDSEFSRKQIVSVLKSGNLNVVGEASSAREALESMARLKANLMLIDVVLPERNGIELAKVIQEQFQGVYVIMISSLAQEHIIMEAVTNGAVDFIQKPFHPDILLSSVSKVKKLLTEGEK